jgi:hypothetical protein
MKDVLRALRLILSWKVPKNNEPRERTYSGISSQLQALYSSTCIDGKLTMNEKVPLIISDVFIGFHPSFELLVTNHFSCPK